MTETKEEECWICLSKEKSLMMIHPCACTGTCGSVHRECLDLWIRNSGRFDCPNCKSNFVMQQNPESTWNATRAGYWCVAMAMAESAVAFVVMHLPLVVLFPLCYASQSSAINENTRLATAALMSYGGELLLMLVLLLIVYTITHVSGHPANCTCHSCRRGSSSVFSDFHYFFLYNRSPTPSVTSSSSTSSSSSGGGGGGDGKGVPVLIVIALIVVMALFYFLFLGMVGYIIHRHVRKFYARQKMNAFSVASIRP